MARKRVLVCGATGFIGRNMVEALASTSVWDVVGVYNRRPPFDFPGCKWVQGDLTRPEDVERCLDGVDIVIQAAAVTSGAKDIVNRPHIHVTDNAVMNSLILRAAHDQGISHVLFFSCSVMYPSSSDPLKETDFDAGAEMNPNYFGAGWTKVYIEKMCEFYSRLGQTRFTVIRHSNTYGPYDKFDLERSHVFGATMTKVLRCADGEVVVWGDGSEERDLLHVSDLADFVKRAMVRQDTDFCLCNVGYGSTISISGLVQKMIAASGKEIRIKYDLSRPTIKTRLALDCSRARDLFGWERKISLDEGIRKTMAWYLTNER